MYLLAGFFIKHETQKQTRINATFKQNAQLAKLPKQAD